MIPFHFAIEMVNRGWVLRNTIIWKKYNCTPESVKDRFTVDF
jgi:site-specific DNA-methyltransferase (adenine-specific)